MQHEIIKTAEVQKSMKLPLWLTKWVMKVTKIKDLNKLYDSCYPAAGIDLMNAALDYNKTNPVFSEEEMAKIPQEGAFITVSNHPFGLLDGIMIIAVIGRKRKDYKVIANYLLSMMEPLKDCFISVDPFEGKNRKSGMGAFQRSLQRIEAGHPIGIFPAGEVATTYDGNKEVTDRPWSLSSMRLIKKANVPVIPIHFGGYNSPLFHFLGKIHPMLRTVAIPSEFFKKSHQDVRFSIGDPIPAEVIQNMDKPDEIRTFLRSKVFELEKKK
ncbi:1-acyl-sn-glycerol-3-phosphate acyltransferase [Persicobacter diffluens]|uniref:Phospholipid/glycerol acyltransferase domain-containing protein n=1 Tax=Persicobacter diffluens TaxID=981 RepID=A0AAN5AP92_9BACT|nr:hypothetical protein PEDI_41350 [Persicobacter diffluens]